MQLDPHDVALCVADDGPPLADGAVPASTPIVQTSLFAFPTFADFAAAIQDERRHHVYTRGQNPTVEAAELKLATLERGEACKCFGSGMAAIAAVMFGLLNAGDHVLFVNHIYGPTLQLARQLRRFGVQHDVVLDTEPAAIERAIRPETRLIWIESPGTMMFRLLDLGAVARLAKARGIVTCIDNSWATPLLQKPIEHGIDLVVHTATKYIGGHGDLVAGAVIGSHEHIDRIFRRAYLLLGGVLAPFDAWVMLRGLRTLPVRLAQHERDGLHVAEALMTHKAVRRIHHPAFSDEPDALRRQLRGYTGTFAFELVRDDFESVSRVIDALHHFRIGVSWGGVESLVLSPNRGNNADQLVAQRIPHGLIRISVGLEGAELLTDDLFQALDQVA